MKFRSLVILLSLISFSNAFSQVLKPVKWTFTASKSDAKVGDEIDLIFKATVDADWYIYATDFDPDCGPMLTEIFLNDPVNFETVGTFKAIGSTDKYDSIFGCDVKIFKESGEFRQRIKVTGTPLKISGSIEGQVCKDVCIPFAEDFVFDKISVTGKSQKSAIKKTETTPSGTTQEQKPTDKNSSDTVAAASVTIEKAKASNFPLENKGPQIDRTILEGEPDDENTSIAGYMLLAFILGFTSLITPCVFPMIPMTVTFFLKDDQPRKVGIRNAVIFGLSIIVIYTIAGTIFAFSFGADGLNALATHWIPNLFVFVMFIVFALSFLGLFEINAPYKLVNKADRAAEKGGLVGIFFMSATLVLVSFSCTIPIVGNVLVLSAGGEVIKPVLGMLAYSAAFAIPFTLFAIFPEWMRTMPKSGGWLNTVKVTLGLIELALAFKFLSIVDQTYHWGILDREINIAIWIVVATVLGFYFLGKIRMSGDSPVEKITVSRLMFAIITFTFVVYLIPGLWGAPLKALAGYLPPMHTHDFDLIAMTNNERANEICEPPKHADFLHLPHGLKGYFDYDQALACARQQNKPLFIDFTGHGCVNCREMEARVWSDPEVLARLQNDFVVVALYVDDKTQLPASAWYTSTYDQKVKKTIGKQNADLQIRNLNNNAQPFYVLVGKDERVLAWPKAYDTSVENFVEFLETGKKTYKSLYAN
ncbi:MAG TPA: thioredoxin family protein [Chryseosolibacter sp.]|nr:thioredoxin family protein [Chryseosolibacter sp.]